MTEQQNRFQLAASELFAMLSEDSGDILEDAYEETWVKGDYLDALDANHPGLEAHREATFRGVLAELAAMCLERSLGRNPTEGAGS